MIPFLVNTILFISEPGGPSSSGDEPSLWEKTLANCILKSSDISLSFTWVIPSASFSGGTPTMSDRLDLINEKNFLLDP